MKFKENRLPALNASAFWRVKSFLLLTGFITKTNGIFLSIHQRWFELSHFQAMLAPMCFFLASLFIAPIAGGSLQYLGYRRGILLALYLTLVSCIAMSLTHCSHSYPLFLGAIFLLGMAMKSLLIAGASYAMCVGPEETQSGRLSLGQGFYSLGGLSAPILFFLVFLFFQVVEVHVVWGAYALFAAASVVIALSLAFLPRLPVRENLTVSAKQTFFPKMSLTLLLGFGAMFMYMGMEVCLDSFIVKFLTDPAGEGLPLKYSIAFFSIYYLGYVVGRFFGSYVLNRLALYQVLIGAISLSMLLFIIGITFKGTIAICALLLTGFPNSILYPSLIAISVQNDSQEHSKITGFITTAAIGGALFPPLQGFLADAYGLRLSFYLLIIPYLWVLGHGFYIRSKERARKLKEVMA